MKQLVLWLFACSTVFASGQINSATAETPESAGRDTERTILALQKQVLHAIVTSDTSVMDRLYADDYLAIHGDGKLTTKVQEIENFRSGVTKYESITVHEAKVRVYGDTAVVNAFAAVKTKVNGLPYSGDVRNTRVWVRQDGNWKLVLFQTTRVAP